MFDAVQQGVVATAPDGRVRLWNRRAEILCGWKSQDVLGLELGTLFRPESGLTSGFPDVLASGASWKGVCFVSRRDGSSFRADVMLTSLRETDGRAAGVLAFFEPPENIRQDASPGSESRFDEGASLLRALTAQTRDIVFTCDASGRLTSLNPAFETLTGWKADVWIGRNCSELFPLESPAAVPVGDRPADGSPVSQELRLRLPDGKSLVLETSVVTLHPAGSSGGSLGVARDVTEMRRLERALERSSRFTALGRLAATLAHEFNNVLMGIQATIELADRTGDAGSQARHIAALRSSVARGRGVTKQVLLFTRMPEPARDRIVVSDLIVSLQSELRALAGSAVRVELDVDRGCELSVLGDAGQLQQVLTNLVVNAREAMPSGGTITIGVAPSRDEDTDGVVLSVRDTGIGIAEELLPLIFEPLFTMRKSGGTGLGLAIVAQIVERHGGSISVASEVQRGTTFEIRLPVSRVVREAEAVPARPSRIPRRILIVDDDELIAAGLTAVLELEGVEAESVGLGALVIEAVERFRPEVVLLDVDLPDISGLEIFPRLARLWPTLPVILSSGHADPSAMGVAMEGLPAAFLLKPYEVTTLLETIARVTEK
jgi:two-component system cell cycle sensor histidine kinase/response regulator CckA